jgi:hypothetical protein
MPAPNTITTMAIAGGKLMKIAAQIYGDPTQWNRIAAQTGETITRGNCTSAPNWNGSSWAPAGQNAASGGFGAMAYWTSIPFSSSLLKNPLAKMRTW